MKTTFSALTGCAFAVCFWAAGAHAKDFGDGLENLSPSRVLTNQNAHSDHWKSIGRIRSDDGSSCTATLIDTRADDSTSATPAYVLTSGHCLYRKDNGVIITDLPVTGTITFNYFADTVEHQQPYPLKRINWSSMQGVDLAIVELHASLDSLIAAGIEPLHIAQKTPAAGADILVVGAPLGFESPYLRMAACTLQQSDEFIEQPWVWRHTVKNQCQDLKQGSSGSPVLTRETNQIVAVLNTTTLSSNGQNAAVVPVDETPPLRQSGNFGNPVSYLRQCFVAGQFQTDPEICPLFPTFSVEPSGIAKYHTKVKLSPEGKEIYPDWDMAFAIDKPFYRYKTVRQAIQCENPRDYSPAITAENARINARIGPQTGLHMLCILGVDSADERPSIGLMRNALTLATELQAAGPASPAQVQISRRADSYVITWHFDTQQISKQTLKVGPVSSTDCSDAASYRGAWRRLILRPHQLPAKVCTIAYDHAGQPSAIREDVLERVNPEAG